MLQANSRLQRDCRIGTCRRLWIVQSAEQYSSVDKRTRLRLVRPRPTGPREFQSTWLAARKKLRACRLQAEKWRERTSGIWTKRKMRAATVGPPSRQHENSRADGHGLKAGLRTCRRRSLRWERFLGPGFPRDRQARHTVLRSGLRSCLPLRGSPGFAPGSLFNADRSGRAASIPTAL